MTVESLLERDRFAARLGARLTHVSARAVALEMDLADHHLDSSGRPAAGVIFSLADCAMSLVSNRAATAVAVATHLAYQGGGAGARRLHAEVSAVSGRGPQRAWHATITADGHPIAAFTGTTLDVEQRR